MYDKKKVNTTNVLPIEGVTDTLYSFSVLSFPPEISSPVEEENVNAVTGPVCVFNNCTQFRSSQI